MKTIIRTIRNTYLIIKETFMYPTCYSEINLETGEIIKYKTDPRR